MITMGIDAAMRKSGLVIFDGESILYQAIAQSRVNKKGHFLHLITEEKDEKIFIHDEKCWYLYAYELATIISNLLDQYKVESIALEQYSFHSIGRHHDIAEFTGVIKAFIYKHHPNLQNKFIIVPKTSHYSNTAAAHSTKEDLIAAIEYHDGIVFKECQNDLADAYSLAKYYHDKVLPQES